MHSHTQRLDQCTLKRAHVFRQFVDQMCRMRQIIAHCALIGWAGDELHIRAEIVAAGLTVFAVAAADARFQNNPIPRFDIHNTLAHGFHNAGSLMAQD